MGETLKSSSLFRSHLHIAVFIVSYLAQGVGIAQEMKPLPVSEAVNELFRVYVSSDIAYLCAWGSKEDTEKLKSISYAVLSALLIPAERPILEKVRNIGNEQSKEGARSAVNDGRCADTAYRRSWVETNEMYESSVRRLIDGVEAGIKKDIQ